MKRLRPYIPTLLWCLLCVSWVYPIIQDRIIFQEFKASILKDSDGREESDYSNKELYKKIEALKNGTTGNWWQSWTVWEGVFFVTISAASAGRSFYTTKKKLSQSDAQAAQN